MYIYKSHLSGGLYTLSYYENFNDLYCEQCGDSNEYLGFASNKEEARALICDGYDKDYVECFLDGNFEE